MNYFTKTVLMIGLAFLPNSVLGKSTPTPTPSSSSVQDEDITATSVEEFPSSGLVKLDKVISDKFRSKSQHSLREFSKPWKFKNIYSFLPKNIQDKNHPNLSSDDSGNYLVADNFLYDGKSNRIIFQASQYNGLEISSNGKYLYVRGPEEGQEGNKFNGMYLIPEMTKISISKGWVFSWFLGRGRFAIVLKNNQQGIVDLENPNQVIKKAIVWGNFFESQNGEMILNQEDKEMVLYNLPDFSIKQKFSDIGSGTPFINSTGTIIGCNRGLCYLVNTITGVTKSFGINGDNCSDLVEGASIQNNFTKQRLKKIPQAPISMDVVTKIISLSTFKTLKRSEPAESDTRYLPGPINGKSCGVFYVITPKDSPDVWLVINQFNSHDVNDHSGQALFLRIGEDLKIKKVLHFPKTINGANWEEDSHSIMGKTYDDEFFQINISPE